MVMILGSLLAEVFHDEAKNCYPGRFWANNNFKKIMHAVTFVLPSFFKAILYLWKKVCRNLVK